MTISILPILLLSVVFSSVAHGANYYNQPASGTVKSIVVNSPFPSSRNIIVEIKDSSGTLTLCGGSADSGYINKSDNPDTFNALLSVLLSAKVTQNTVSVLTADGSEGCRIDRVELK
ncbi:hypothetical protein FKG94_18465 [Exilibacterium tricleocarpae]|uniref:Uncharacterized protein n=1 Tax=Exilibacterium tricleocarpae TaxID=2591008 RepID=A0A545T627_9GAMM|nr:hypothetical protein [Exilibacterium tricleocarpae]TQV72673.1 hypothetical protein FKG94_18465 [Exilibacterium tricleocarpae]